jgi:hypothetical protein
LKHLRISFTKKQKLSKRFHAKWHFHRWRNFLSLHENQVREIHGRAQSAALTNIVRDEWEQKKGGLDKKLSDLMGVEWKFEFNPNAIYPYAIEDSYMKNSPGACLYALVSPNSQQIHAQNTDTSQISYAEAVPYGFEYFITSRYDEQMKTEINTIAHAHVVTMEHDDAGTVKYCSCDIKDGKIRILFNSKELGVNINNLYEELPKRLNEAEQPAGADGKVPVLGPQARLNISKEYNEQIKPV